MEEQPRKLVIEIFDQPHRTPMFAIKIQ